MSELSNYQLIRMIGSGASGDCFLFEQICDRAKVCIKRSTNPNLLKEAGNLKKISSPFIIKYLNHFKDQADYYLVMEYAPQGSLRQLINHHIRSKTPFSEIQIIHFMIQILEGLKCLHNHSPHPIIHRNVKPQSILVFSEDLVKIGHLGLAMELSNESFTRDIIGTFIYLPPEAFLSDAKITTSFDIWGLGCTLYEMAMLKHPFYNEGMNQRELESKIKLSTPPTIPVSDDPVNNPGKYSPLLIAIINGMLEKEEENRIRIEEILNHVEIKLETLSHPEWFLPLSSFSSSSSSSSSSSITLYNDYINSIEIIKKELVKTRKDRNEGLKREKELEKEKEELEKEKEELINEKEKLIREKKEWEEEKKKLLN